MYAVHFDAEWRARQCRGYEVLLDLHENSNDHVFGQARALMKGEFFIDAHSIVQHLEAQLMRSPCFLNITFEKTSSEYHSLTVFSDGVNTIQPFLDSM